MGMGQGIRTGLGHRRITCVLQAQFSGLPSILESKMALRWGVLGSKMTYA